MSLNVSKVQEAQITDGYWYPLVECTLPDIVAFDANASNDAVKDQQLQDVLSNRGIERVWELEYGPEYEVDVSRLVPRCNAAGNST
jgi:hypothetical protein